MTPPKICATCGKQRYVGSGQIKPKGTVCIYCQKERQRVNARRQYEAHKAERREAMKAWKQANHDKQLAYERAHYARVKADPVAYAKYRENARLTYRLRREKQGRPIAPLTPAEYAKRYPQANGTSHGSNGTLLPVGPLQRAIREWLDPNDLINEMTDDGRLGLNSKMRLSRISGVDEKRIRDLLNGAQSVSLHNADRLATALGTHIDVLYGETR